MILQERIEGDVNWSVDLFIEQKVRISAFNARTNKKAEGIYRCFHIPVFGMDMEDVAQINKLLDACINAVKY